MNNLDNGDHDSLFSATYLSRSDRGEMVKASRPNSAPVVLVHFICGRSAKRPEPVSNYR